MFLFFLFSRWDSGIFVYQFALNVGLMLCSCLIARNLLSGLKTCMEVSCYMHDGLGALTPNKSIVPPSSLIEDNGKADMEYIVSIPSYFSCLLISF